MSAEAEPTQPPIADYGFLSDCSSAALVSRRGSIDWCALPRLDRGSCFARLLDSERGGHCSIVPTGPVRAIEREYLERTMALVTILRTDEGEVRVTDCLLRPGPTIDDRPDARLLRLMEAVDGEVEIEIDVYPRFDYGAVAGWLRRHSSGLHSATAGDDTLLISSDLELSAAEHHVRGRAVIGPGHRHHLLLEWVEAARLATDEPTVPTLETLEEELEEALGWWREWAQQIAPEPDPIVRSALTVKALSQTRTGAIAAAATTSLPEGLGATGERNWDYRYSWVRDSTLAVRSLARLGLEDEALAFRRFIERSAAGQAADLQVVFGLDGSRRLAEMEIAHLRGYRGAGPVRVGNQAAEQLQLDAYGLLLEQSWRWHERGHPVDPDYWSFLRQLVDAAAERWEEPDCGFWEAREPAHFVHSKAMCWVAIDRGCRLADGLDADAPLDVWRRSAEEIREAIRLHGIDRERNVFVRTFDSPELDASLLRLPTVDYCAFDDPVMVRTTDAIRRELDLEGLVRRYDTDDGFSVPEGAFLACNFWVAECLSRQGRHAEAREIFDRTAATANDLGLFSEEYDPGADELLGNFPQALTHLSLLEAWVALDARA